MNLHESGAVTHGFVTPESVSFRRSEVVGASCVTRYAIRENVHLPSAVRACACAGARPHTYKGVPYLGNYVTEVEEKKKDQVNHPLPRYAARYAAATQCVAPSPSSPVRAEVTHA